MGDSGNAFGPIKVPQVEQEEEALKRSHSRRKRPNCWTVEDIKNGRRLKESSEIKSYLEIEELRKKREQKLQELREIYSSYYDKAGKHDSDCENTSNVATCNKADLTEGETKLRKKPRVKSAPARQQSTRVPPCRPGSAHRKTPIERVANGRGCKMPAKPAVVDPSPATEELTTWPRDRALQLTMQYGKTRRRAVSAGARRAFARSTLLNALPQQTAVVEEAAAGSEAAAEGAPNEDYYLPQPVPPWQCNIYRQARIGSAPAKRSEPANGSTSTQRSRLIDMVAKVNDPCDLETVVSVTSDASLIDRLLAQREKLIETPKPKRAVKVYAKMNRDTCCHALRPREPSTALKLMQEIHRRSMQRKSINAENMQSASGAWNVLGMKVTKMTLGSRDG